MFTQSLAGFLAAREQNLPPQHYALTESLSHVVTDCFFYRLSRNCTTALRKIAESSAAECLNANTLVPLLTLGDTASIDPPINTWLQGLCYNGPSCNNAVLTNITNTIKTECGHDLKAGGLPETTTNHLPQLAIQYYVPAIDALCVRK